MSRCLAPSALGSPLRSVSRRSPHTRRTAGHWSALPDALRFAWAAADSIEAKQRLARTILHSVVTAPAPVPQTNNILPLPPMTTTHVAHTHRALEMKDSDPDQTPADSNDSTPNASPLLPAKLADPALIARLHALIGTSDNRGGVWSQNNISKVMAVPPSYINQWLQHADARGVRLPDAPVLKMNIARFESSIAEFLANIQTRREFAEDLFETALTKDFNGSAAWVSSNQTIGVYHGPGGEGKSSAVGRYARKNGLAWVITAAKPWCCAAEAIIRALYYQATGLHIAPKGRTRAHVLIEKLRGSGTMTTSRIIVIDQFQRLTRSAWQFLTDLHDATRVPILLVGNIEGLRRIEDDEQITRRIGFQKAATWGPDEKAARDAKRAAAEKILARDAPFHAGDLRRMAFTVAEHPGGLGALVQHLRAMYELMKKNECLTAPEAFRNAHSVQKQAGHGYALPES